MHHRLEPFIFFFVVPCASENHAIDVEQLLGGRTLESTEELLPLGLHLPDDVINRQVVDVPQLRKIGELRFKLIVAQSIQ